jgi:hypothetical protein
MNLNEKGKQKSPRGASILHYEAKIATQSISIIKGIPTLLIKTSK